MQYYHIGLDFCENGRVFIHAFAAAERGFAAGKTGFIVLALFLAELLDRGVAINARGMGTLAWGTSAQISYHSLLFHDRSGRAHRMGLHFVLDEAEG